ncbi:MAG: serine protease, partial [Kiritimatiellaceae bacterium]|nr:serine protease [Kiritimatiellaceae bacterium]
MRSLFICLTIFVVMLTGRVLAIAVDDYTVAETNPVVAGYTLDLDYIYTYKSASAVAVDHYWILTAAHVADDPNTKTNLTINDELYTQQEIVFHDSADLALVRYDKPFPGYYSLHDGEIYHEEYEDVRIQGKWVTITNEVYEVLIMAGYGFDGTVASSSFTQGTSTGIKRWGTNRGVLTDYVAAVDV